MLCADASSARALLGLSRAWAATKAVFDNKALIALPLVSVTVSMCALGYFLLVLLYILTPDPLSITRQIDRITHSLADEYIDVANRAADVAIDLSSKAIEKTNALAEQALHNEHLIDVQLHDIEIDGGAWADVNISGILDPAYVSTSAIAFEALAALWVLFCVDAVVYATIAGAITYWYQEREGKGVLPALGRVLRFHLGSMALGSGAHRRSKRGACHVCHPPRAAARGSLMAPGALCRSVLEQASSRSRRSSATPSRGSR